MSVRKFIEFRSLSIPSAHWMLWPRRMVDPSVLTLQQQSSTQALWLTLASYFQTQTREQPSLTMLHTLAELVRLFLCYLEHLWLQLCSGNNLVTLFCQRLLRPAILKGCWEFVNSSAILLSGTLRRECSEIGGEIQSEFTSYVYRQLFQWHHKHSIEIAYWSILFIHVAS